MQSGDKHVVAVLNSLIETAIDTVQGYREAASHAVDPRAKTLFTEQGQRRNALVRRLQNEVRSFGGEPQHEQSELGRLHRKFVDLEGMLGYRDDIGMIDELERGEDDIKARFEAAACDDALPAPLRDLVGEACEVVKADHDVIARIKRQLH